MSSVFDSGFQSAFDARYQSIAGFKAFRSRIYVSGGISGLGTGTDNDGLTPSHWQSRLDLIPPERRAHAVAAIDHLIYAMGGSPSSGVRIADTDEYNPRTNAWTPRANHPGPARSTAQASTLNGKIYMTGGSSDDLLRHDDTDEFNGATWISRADFPLPVRGGHSQATVDNKVYILGGFISGASGRADDVDEYVVNFWVSKTSLGVKTTQLAAMTIGDAIYYSGGNTPTTLNTMTRYDPDVHTARTPFPLPARDIHASSPLNAIVGYIIGGRTFQDEVDQYNRNTNAWIEKGDLIPPGRHALGGDLTT